MSGHERVRELLALAAAGALTAAEEEQVARHVPTCSACSQEMDWWRSMAGHLRRLPTAQPSAGLFERTRLLAEQRLAEEAEYRWLRSVMVFVVTFSWVLAIVSWPVVRLVTGGLLDLLDPRLNRTWISFAGFTALVWLAGGTAAVVLSLGQRRERRVA
jgi:anti-sigma factor RsiW